MDFYEINLRTKGARVRIAERAWFASTDTLAHWLALREARYHPRLGYFIDTLADGECWVTVTHVNPPGTPYGNYVWKPKDAAALLPAVERHRALIAATKDVTSAA